MDMEKIGSSLVKAFKMLGTIVGVVGGVFLALFLIYLILGIIFNLVLSGTISVDATTNSSLTKIQGNFSSLGDSILSGMSLTGSLIVVAVVLIVFGGLVYLGYKEIKKRRGNQGMGGY